MLKVSLFHVIVPLCTKKLMHKFTSAFCQISLLLYGYLLNIIYSLSDSEVEFSLSV